MARKETKQERGRRIMNAGWSDAELNDSLVVERRQKLEEDRRLEEERRKADFRGTTGKIKSTEDARKDPPENYGNLNALRDQFTGGQASKRADETFDELGDLETKYKTPAQRAAARTSLATEANRLRYEQRFSTRDSASGTSGITAELAKIDKAEDIFSTPGKAESMKAQIARDDAISKKRSQRSEAFYDAGGVGSKVVRAGGDVAGSYESAGSIAGGIVGSLAGPAGGYIGAAAGSTFSAGVARRAAYREGKNNGMDEQQAREYSLSVAGSEFALGTVTGGLGAAYGALAKTTVPNRLVDATKVAVTKAVAKQALFGAGDEAGTVGVQAGMSALLMKDDEYSKQAKAFLAEKAYVGKDGKFKTEEFFSDVARSAAAGGATSVGIAGPTEIIAKANMAGKLAATVQKNLNEAANRNKVNREFSAGRNVSGDEQSSTALADSFIRSTLGAAPVDLLRPGMPGLPALDPNMTRQAEAAGAIEANQDFNRNPVGATPVTPVLDRVPFAAPLNGNPDPAFKKANQEAQLLVTRKEKAIAAAEKRKLKKVENNFKTKVVDESMRMDLGARADYVRDRLEAFRAQAVPALAATTTQPVPRTAFPTPAPVAEEGMVPASTLLDQLDAAPKARAMPSVPTQPVKNAATLKDVSIALVKQGRGSALTNRLGNMIGDGNVEFVQSQNDIPAEAGDLTLQGRGWYAPATGKVYVVADQLSKNDIKGQVLQTLAHENKHGVDSGGSKDIRSGSFASFIGEEANEKMANSIRGYALKNPKSVAARVVAKVDKEYAGKGFTPEQVRDELVTNFADQEIKNTKGLSGLGRTLVSAVRTGAKTKLRMDGVRIEDIGYLANQLVRETALRGERFSTENGNPSPMTISGGTSEATQIRNNRTWLSADKSRKYEISDKESAIEIPGDYMDRDFTAKEILKHDKLYNEMPELQNTTIRFDELDPTIGGQYDKENKIITINTATTEFKRGRNMYNGPIHQYILHEMQHVAQGVSGTTSGASPAFFLPNEAKKLDNDIEDLSYAIQYGETTGADTDFLEQRRSEMTQKEREYSEKYGPDTPAYEAATIQYEKVLGELEAYRTNDNVTKTEAELDETGLGQQEVNWDREEGITSDTGKRLRPTTPPRPMPSIADEDDTDTDNRSTFDKVNDSSYGARVLTSLFTSTGGLGGEKFAIGDYKRNLNAKLSSEAEAIFHRLRGNIEANMEELGMTMGEIIDKVDAKLQQVNEMLDVDDRIAAVLELNDSFPGVGTALIDLRNYKWKLSQMVIRQRGADDSRPLSVKEQAIYGMIITNAETYNTRTYMSGQLSAVSKKWAKRMIAKYENDPDSKEGQIVTNGLEFIKSRHLIIPDLEGLQELDKKELTRLYEQWKGEAKGVDQEEMISVLDAIKRPTEEVVDKKAMEIAKELMGRKTARGTVARSYGGSKQNRTILEGREDVPKEIRALMGEVTNPIAAEMLSITRLINLTTQTNFLAEYYDKGKDRWWSDINDISKTFTIQLKGEAYGPMQGKWVNEATAMALEPTIAMKYNLQQALDTSMKDPGKLAEFFANFVTGPLQKVTTAQKLVDLVFSPMAALFNYGGAYVILAQNGVGPITGLRAQNLTIDVMQFRQGKRFPPERQVQINEAILSGVLDSATVGELQGSTYDSIFRLLSDIDMEGEQGIGVMWEKLKRAVKDGTITAKDMYAFADVWAKVGSYLDNMEYRIKFNAAEGIEMTRDELIRDVGQKVNAANISYTRAIPIFRKIERNLPYYAMYLTYFSEVPRSVVYSYAQVITDLSVMKNATTTEGKRLAGMQALKRFTGTTSVLGLMTAGVNYYLNSLSDDEERRRETDPEWEKRGIPIYLGKTKDGKMISFPLLRFDPNGPLSEVLAHLNNMKPGEDISDVLLSTMKSQFVESRGVMNIFRLVKGAVFSGDTINKDDTYGEWGADYLDDLGGTWDPNLGRNFMAAVNSFLPRPVKGITRTIKGTVGGRGYETDLKTQPGTALMQAIGLNPYVRDPEFSLTISASKYNAEEKEVQEKLKSLKGRLGRYDAKEMIQRLGPLVEKEEKAYNRLWKVYDGTKAFNGYYTDKDYAEAAKTIIKAKKMGKVSEDLDTGAFKVRWITRDYLDGWEAARKATIKRLKDPKEMSKENAQLRRDYKMLNDIYLNGKKRAKE